MVRGFDSGGKHPMFKYQNSIVDFSFSVLEHSVTIIPDSARCVCRLSLLVLFFCPKTFFLRQCGFPSW